MYVVPSDHAGTVALEQRSPTGQSYAAYPAIEREMRRRMYWISFGGDQTLALMQAAPVSYHVDENDTALPLMM